MKIIHPIEGDMLHVLDGITEGDGLWVTVVVDAPEGSRIQVGDSLAVYKEGFFRAGVLLRGYENTIKARDERSGEEVSVTVYWLPKFARGYRVSIDDNIWWLRDIYQHAGKYKSIFDNPYLAFLKQVHDRFGTKIHLNIFYQTEGFNLSQLSDEFKSEWQAQSGWLRLSFHALGEFPDMPYKEAGYDQVYRDCALIKGEIERFAGKELMGPVTTIHWGEATVEGSRAMRDLGYKGQLGYFNIDDGQAAVSYYLGAEAVRHIKKRFVWKDTKEDIVFIKTSMVIDKTDLVDIRPKLDAYREADGLPPYVDLLVHEQYYYPFYEAYEPDYRDRILTAVQWAQDNGYTPRFLEECIF